MRSAASQPEASRYGHVCRSKPTLASDAGTIYGNGVEKSALTFEVELPGGEDRLRELVLYVSKKCESAKRFGKVKLNKILWRADFTAFRDRGRPVTGCSYQKLAAGPAPLGMDELLAGMQTADLIRIKEVHAGGDYLEHRVIGSREANLAMFDAHDMYFVDKSIDFYWGKSASKASDLSHRAAWKTRNFLEKIPYESAYLSDDRLSRTERERLAKEAEIRAWTSL